MSTGRGWTSSREFLGFVFLALLALVFSLPMPARIDSPRPTGLAQEEAPREDLSADVQRILDASAELPLRFIANAGQVQPPAVYYAEGPGYRFSFTEEEAILSFIKGRGDAARGATLLLAFQEANPDVRLEAQERLPGTVNYLIGSDPARWRTGVPTYQEVGYRDLWPGIDLLFRGGDGTLKYVFHVEPGRTPEDIRLVYAGARGLSLSPRGSLLINTPLGTLRDAAPLSYQIIGGRRVPVESRYRLPQGSNEYGFAVGIYDPRYPLIIDPGLRYSTYLGGGGRDQSNGGVAVDGQGNAYVTGYTLSVDFPTTPGAFQPVRPGSLTIPCPPFLTGHDAFVTKVSPDGSTLMYSTYLGGATGCDEVWDIAVDEGGHAYLGGYTNSVDLPTTPGAFQPADPDPAGNDGFVAKLSADGSALVYSTYLGGTGSDDGVLGIDIDNHGHAYAAGDINSPDFPTTPGAFDQTFNGVYDAFVAKLNQDGSDLIYSTYLGGSDSDLSQHSIAVDPLGNVYVGGGTKSSDFPTTPGAFQSADPDPTGDDAYVAKLNQDGSALVYSTYLGGPSSRGPTIFSNEPVLGLDVDENGRAYVTGRTDSLAFPTTPGAFDTSFNGGAFDAFVAQLERDGSALVASTYLGGAVTETGWNITLAKGHPYVVGNTVSMNFPTTPRAFQPADPDPAASDAYVTEFRRDLSVLLYSTYLGGTGFDQAFGVAVRDDGTAYVTGWTDASNFPTTPEAFQPADPNPVPGLAGRDVFVTKLQTEPVSPTA